MPPASAAASRLAAHWVADALASNEALDFSAIEALVAVSSESLAGAPAAARDRVALRCLQELVAVASEGGAAPEPAQQGMLRVDAARSCEDLLLELIGKVGTYGSLEKNTLLPFTQDIQNIICIKKPTLAKTCFKLLREVVPESMAPTFTMEQNDNNKHDEDPSLCNINPDHVIIEKPRFPTDLSELQQENLANFVSETGTVNLQKDPIKPTPDIHQQCTLDSRCHENPQEDYIAVVDSITKSPEKNTNVKGGMSVVTVLTSDISNVAFQGRSIIDATEANHLPELITAHDTTITPQPNSSKIHLDSPQHDSGEKVNQDLDGGGASIQSTENDPMHGELPLRAGNILRSVSCHGTIEGGKSETNHPPGNATEHTTMFEQQDVDKSHPEASLACKDNKTVSVYDDAIILEKRTIHGEPNVQTAPDPCSCNAALHDKISETNDLSQQNIGKNTSDVQKRSCSISAPNSAQDGDGKGAKETSGKNNFGNTVVESHVHSSDDSFSDLAAAGLLSMSEKVVLFTREQDANGSLRDFLEQDLCIKCGKHGQLLKCIKCKLTAHDICFGSLVTEDPNEFCCPVCFYTKATEAYQNAKETYCEARRNLSAFLGTKKLVKEPTRVLPNTANNKDLLNGCNSSKRQNSHQTEADIHAGQSEEPDQHRKKQKTNATYYACSDKVDTARASFVQDSNVAPMNKYSVIWNNKKQDQDAEQEQKVENTEACEEGGNLSPETRNSSENRCDPSANQEVEADKEFGRTNSNQSKDSDEVEATSSNDCSKQLSPPWCNTRHRKARLLARKPVVSSNSRKTVVQKDQHMPSPSRKRNYVYPLKRYSNPMAPTGRRSKLCWTEEEETTLREAMTKFIPLDNGPIPWSKMLDYGSDVFHRTRLPCDLRVKWRNMEKKVGS